MHQKNSVICSKHVLYATDDQEETPNKRRAVGDLSYIRSQSLPGTSSGTE